MSSADVLAGQQATLGQARQHQIGVGRQLIEGLDHLRLRGPQSRAQIGVERHDSTLRPCLCRQGEHQCLRTRRQRRADAAQVQQARASAIRFHGLVAGQVTRRRATAEVLGLRVGAAVLQRLEHEAGGMGGIDRDAAVVDPLRGQEGQQRATETVLSHAAGVADPKAQAAHAHRDVQFGPCGGPAEARHLLQRPGLAGDEQGHRFTDRDQVQRRAAGLACRVHRFIHGTPSARGCAPPRHCARRRPPCPAGSCRP